MIDFKNIQFQIGLSSLTFKFPIKKIPGFEIQSQVRLSNQIKSTKQIQGAK